MTSVSLDSDSTGIIERHLASGRFDDASEVVRCSLRLLDTEEARLAELRVALDEGEASGPAEEFDFDAFLASRRTSPKGA